MPMLLIQSAAKLSAAARQKHPDSHILMALHSVALWRSGRTEEALQVGLTTGRAAGCYHIADLHQQYDCAMASRSSVECDPCVASLIWQVADDLLAAGPTEEQVLRTLTLALRPAGQGSRLAAAWEAASAQQPRNQELLLGCFQSSLG
jgi:hypothetical protein